MFTPPRKQATPQMFVETQQFAKYFYKDEDGDDASTNDIFYEVARHAFQGMDMKFNRNAITIAVIDGEVKIFFFGKEAPETYTSEVVAFIAPYFAEVEEESRIEANPEKNWHYHFYEIKKIAKEIYKDAVSLRREIFNNSPIHEKYDFFKMGKERRALYPFFREIKGGDDVVKIIHLPEGEGNVSGLKAALMHNDAVVEAAFSDGKFRYQITKNRPYEGLYYVKGQGKHWRQIKWPAFKISFEGGEWKVYGKSIAYMNFDELVYCEKASKDFQRGWESPRAIVEQGLA